VTPRSLVRVPVRDPRERERKAEPLGDDPARFPEHLHDALATAAEPISDLTAFIRPTSWRIGPPGKTLGGSAFNPGPCRTGPMKSIPFPIVMVSAGRRATGRCGKESEAGSSESDAGRTAGRRGPAGEMRLPGGRHASSGRPLQHGTVPRPEGEKCRQPDNGAAKNSAISSSTLTRSQAFAGRVRVHSGPPVPSRSDGSTSVVMAVPPVVVFFWL